MSFAPLINGTQYSGTSVRVNILGVSIAGLKSVRYKRSQEKSNIYGAGVNVNSRSYGKKQAEGSITILLNDYFALERAAPSNDITNIPPFDIIVSWVESSNVVVHTLHNVEFTEIEVNAKTEDTEIPIELPIIMTHVSVS